MSATSSFFHKDPQNVLNDIDYQFQLEPPTLTRLSKAFLDEFALGLANYGKAMAMIPTFVTGVPDGSETGTFLALDLGGTNLRVCQVTLRGDKTFDLRHQKYKVSETLKTGEARALFDYLADSVDSFLTSGPTDQSIPPTVEQSDVLPLGLTFSFPVEQTALNSGKILTWTKGFSAKNAVGNDVVQLLQDAFNRKHIHVKCVALVNDTVGALLSRAYTSGGCILGGIFGTGTNGAYVERVSNITKLGNSPAAARGGFMVVNTEWGGFNNSRSHLPFTPFDNIVDRQSINPRFQAFEKFVSGMYLGEIVRNVLLSLIDAAPTPILFGGKSTGSLNTHYGLDTSVLSDVELAYQGDGGISSVPNLTAFDPDQGTKERLERVRTVIVDRLGFGQDDDIRVTLKDAAIVRWACSLVARRAALLSGVAVAAVLLQTGRAALPAADGSHPAGTEHQDEERVNIGVDGSLIEFYPGFEDTLRESLRAIVGDRMEQKVSLGMAKDGSGVGAALCALQAIKQGL